ncbi:hypothetical protein IC582_016930 [Cucumis melo]
MSLGEIRKWKKLLSNCGSMICLTEHMKKNKELENGANYCSYVKFDDMLGLHFVIALFFFDFGECPW